MAYPIDHKNDTIKAIGNATSPENAEILRDLVHLVVDAQITTNGKEECKSLLQKLQESGIVSVDELCKRFMQEGVNQAVIDKYNGNKEQFLVEWFLPPHSPNHQLYTHKGWDYDYSQEDDKDYWGAVEIKQSWEVKKYLLVKTVEKIFAVSASQAIALSVLLYNIHRLRDIQYNNYTEATAAKKQYLFNACAELEQYVLPLIGDKNLKEQTQRLLNTVEKTISNIPIPINDDFWEELNTSINGLLSSIEDTQTGLVTEVVSAIALKDIG